MAKHNSLLRGSRRRHPDSSDKIDVEKAKIHSENVMVILLMSAVETVIQDFQFDADKAKKFQELVQARAMIKFNALK